MTLAPDRAPAQAVPVAPDRAPATAVPLALPLDTAASRHRPRPTAERRVALARVPDVAAAVTAPAGAASASAAPAGAAVPAERPVPLPPARPTDIPRLTTSARDLLALARGGLAEAAACTTPADRYAAAHLSALRSAAAVIAARARPADPGARRPRPLSAWVLLATVAPELGEWAAFFAAGARKRAAAEAHLPGSVTSREADDLLRDAETFLAVVETKLGAQPSLLTRGVG